MKEIFIIGLITLSIYPIRLVFGLFNKKIIINKKAFIIQLVETLLCLFSIIYIWINLGKL